MDVLGINWGYVLVMLFNILLLGGWFVLTILALFQLRHRELPETARAIWALILLVPIVGAVAFWIARPGNQLPRKGENE